MREKETYRLELEAIYARFGNRAMLTAKEVSEYTGHCPQWCRDKLGVNKDGITSVKLAYILSHRENVPRK